MPRHANFFALALALLALALLPAQAGAQAPTRTIAVVGDASLTARNDTARVGFAVAARGRDRRTAIARTSVKLRRVLKALTTAGIADPDLRTGSISVFRLTDRRGRPIPGRFGARQSVTARVRDVGNTGAVVNAVVNAGGIPVEGPTFFISDPKALLRRALVAALRDAREKAAQLAAEAGLTLGAPVRIRESGFVGSDDPLFEERSQGGGGVQGETPLAAPPPTRVGNTRVDGKVFVVFEAQGP